MKIFQSKKIALLLVLALIVPMFWNQSTAVAIAATTPKLVKSKVEITGEGEVYQLEIKDKVAKSKYKWTSSDTKVAKVSSKGLVTTVNKGTTTIKCKITYPTKKTKTLSCKVTVVIPATEIAISNSVETNGTHTMTLGQTFDFNHTLVPTKTSDKVVWTVGGGDAACIRIDNASEGIVTATKAGKVILVATAAKTTTTEAINASIIKDAVIIEVVGPTATVRSADIISSTEIKVVFDSPVDKNTVIGLNNKLSSNIEVSMRKDVKNVLAADPGTLTASLSADLQTLTITSAKMFDGEYGINFTSNILTTGGVAMETYYKQLSFVDNFPPSIVSVDLDDTGMIATIRFSEVIDFTDFKVSNAAVVSGMTVTAEQSTISILNNRLNYIASTDKKSLTINLSTISVADYGKVFSVIISGIKDMNGNSPASYTLNAYLQTDTSMKPQARPLSVVRSSYNTITATFDRAIKIGGQANINGGPSIGGIVDSTNNKKVNYTLSSSEALFTGIATVSLGYWDAYNVILNDTTSQQMRNFSVDFTTDKTNPYFSYEYDVDTNILTLTFNKDVILSVPSGVFSTTLNTVTDDIRSGTNITYTKIAVTDNSKVIKLQLGNMTLLGNYTFTINAGFVSDSFNNQSLSRAISISNSNGASTELPGPYLISQSQTNLSQIYLEFANKLDLVSAETVANYTIPGVTILSAKLTKNASDSGATVLLTVADSSIDITIARPIKITGLTGYHGSYSEMVAFTQIVELKDNKKPYYISAQFDTSTKTMVKLNFSEEIKGSLVVKVTNITNGLTIDITNTVTISGNIAYINLGSMPMNNSALKIEVQSNTITDLVGNASAAMSSTLGLSVSY